jgi:fructose-1,6-bisphosphatase/sedoheptulose 1,7-bisphosphatase-like protein
VVVIGEGEKDEAPMLYCGKWATTGIATVCFKIVCALEPAPYCRCAVPTHASCRKRLAAVASRPTGIRLAFASSKTPVPCF